MAGVASDSSAFPGLAEPNGLTSGEIGDIDDAFGYSARRADRGGFDLLELQAAQRTAPVTSSASR
ncbi:MAG TPA: hypothetical protein VFN32_07755 [Rhodococcus sp. (in: high G+C Gram-positive bacteria)]|nr:hypothetical protein [Rhodococcus sp. (in: high G+C Gram-positive bacteria)]